MGTKKVSYDVFWLVMIVIAPGGKLVATCDIHIRSARAHSDGVARKAEGLQIVNGLDLMQNKCSIVETLIVEMRRRRHRYCTNATAKAPLSANPLCYKVSTTNHQKIQGQSVNSDTKV